MIKTATIGVPDIVIDDAYILEKQYSFAKVKLGRAGIALMTLARIDNGIYTWVSSSGERLETVNGKIIKISGSAFDFELFGYHQFSLLPGEAPINMDVQAMLQSPRAFIELESNTTQLTLSDNNNAYYFEEHVSTNAFKWSFVNKYWVDVDSKLPSKSIQTVHPKQAPIEISYYYK